MSSNTALPHSFSESRPITATRPNTRPHHHFNTNTAHLVVCDHLAGNEFCKSLPSKLNADPWTLHWGLLYNRFVICGHAPQFIGQVIPTTPLRILPPTMCLHRQCGEKLKSAELCCAFYKIQPYPVIFQKGQK